MIIRAMSAVSLLLVDFPVPDNTKVTIQIKSDILVRQVGGWA
jgi:hypothetical protein